MSVAHACSTCMQAGATEAAQGGCAEAKVGVRGEHMARQVCEPGHRRQPRQLGGCLAVPGEVRRCSLFQINEISCSHTTLIRCSDLFADRSMLPTACKASRMYPGSVWAAHASCALLCSPVHALPKASVTCRVMACQVLKACLQDLAAQYRHVKFLTIPSTECIPNYPDENLPTLLVYHDGQCKRTIVGTQTLGIDRISPESEHPL